MSDIETDALEAQQLLSNKLLIRILADIERDAIEIAIGAVLPDHELRASAIGEVRAVRSFANKLHSLIDDANTARLRKGSPV